MSCVESWAMSRRLSSFVGALSNVRDKMSQVPQFTIEDEPEDAISATFSKVSEDDPLAKINEILDLALQQQKEPPNMMSKKPKAVYTAYFQQH